jgi:hypothetical protein
MEQASRWLSRINTENTDVNISSVEQQLDKDRKSFKESYLDEHLHEIAIDDYIWNHVDKVKELFQTDSIDKRVNILEDARDTIMDRFGYYRPETPSYDELEEYIRQAVIEAKNSKGAPGEYYEDLDIEE